MVVINQITQKEVDKPHINLKGYLSTYKLFMNLEMGDAHLRGNLVGGVIGCQVTNFSIAVWLIQQFARRIVIGVLSQRDITTAYDEDHANFTVSEFLGTLKKGSGSNHHRGRYWAKSWPCLWSTFILVQSVLY